MCYLTNNNVLNIAPVAYFSSIHPPIRLHRSCYTCIPYRIGTELGQNWDRIGVVTLKMQLVAYYLLLRCILLITSNAIMISIMFQFILK